MSALHIELKLASGGGRTGGTIEDQNSMILYFLKVSSFRKQIFLFSFEPKNKRNYFLISALRIKNGSNKKKLRPLFDHSKKDLFR